MGITKQVKVALKEYLENHRKPELVNAYLFYLEESKGIRPVVFPPGKLIFQGAPQALALLEQEGKVWRETEIKITFSPSGVNEQTKKIYICPFTGKVFGDNTHPNPQDAIYDWVSRCPENTERVDGLRVKRFLVSEDPEVIRSYLDKNPHKDPISKTVYSSAQSGKLYHSKESVVMDFKKTYLKPISLIDVQNQNRFQIEPGFLEYLQAQLDEDKIAAFVEELADHEEFMPYIELWVDVDDQENGEEVEAASN
jgi:hypothetical protein